MAGLWRKTMVYLGLAEEEEYDDYEYEEPQRNEGQASSVTRLPESAPVRKDAVVRAVPAPEPSVRFHLVLPSEFNDAQEVGDKFRQGYSVLMNLQGTEPDLRRRLIDFAAGLSYGLEGSMKQVADKVFLITPPGVQVSAEERRRLLEDRGFFNQA
jgi:FtsZ-interacting cell division protein YlmF